MKDEIKIFAGSSNRPLATAICHAVRVPLGQAEIGRFSDGECQVEITENVRGSDVFVVQSTCTPTNDNLMELLLMLDAFKRASPHIEARVAHGIGHMLTGDANDAYAPMILDFFKRTYPP